jgi:nucleoside-diphosphate-sugar epimerase
MPSIKNPSIPAGSLILVSGANGFLGTHITSLFIKEGYKVRGTVRDTSKNAWLKDLFSPDTFELYALPDLTSLEAWKHALEGVSAVVHAAGDTSFRPDADAVITPEVAALKAAVKAATESLSVKRFVLTSSSIAAAFPRQDVEYTVGAWDFNDEAVKLAWQTSTDPAKGVYVYAAAKAGAEKAMWEAAKKNKDIVFNSGEFIHNCAELILE